MAIVRLLDKNQEIINFIVIELLQRELHMQLFDDTWGSAQIHSLLCDPHTVIYGIFEKESEKPIGVVFFTNTVPRRDCNLYVCLFSEDDRNKGKIRKLCDIKKDFIKRFKVNSISSGTIGHNPVSVHILEKFGFKKIGIKEKYLVSGGEYRDVTIYYLLIED